MQIPRYNLAFFFLLVIDFFLLLFVSDSFSISYKESLIYFEQNNLLSLLTHFFTSVFGQNDIALRLPFVLFYIGSVFILYLLTDDYFKKQSDRFASIIIFMLLPGVNSAALLVNPAILVIFFTLLYLYLRKITQKEHYWLLFLCLFIDNSFAIMYLALFFYSLRKRNNTLLIISLLLFGISMQIYGFDSGGRPKGYFLDTFGIYASIFSPIIFFYFFYAMYRIAIKGEKDLFWYISFTALVFSLLFSLRQKIYIEDFAPFIVISIPLMVKLFMHSFRIRLPQFRKKHYAFAVFSLSILIVNFIIFIANKPLYLVLDRPQKHFANKYHIAKELASELKQKNINEILCKNNKLQERLRFYNITRGKDFYLTDYKNKEYENISIYYYDKKIKDFYIVKLNKELSKVLQN